ncbi:hypothetical protein SSBR45G_45790 [Bradyrhizobium sp. SSBR45G]|nr:hypothetical protein SSBR45G_45790 [Bradyrhizobium sp. SSBR45G]GLH86935.1 hypothetical protein SSBR45R_43950 [Bradyrhizobium sp. SSBR45R]
MRTGMLTSPSPGSSITIAPMRAKASMNTAAKAGRNEMSMRIVRGPGPAGRGLVRLAGLRRNGRQQAGLHGAERKGRSRPIESGSASRTAPQDRSQRPCKGQLCRAGHCLIRR